MPVCVNAWTVKFGVSDPAAVLEPFKTSDPSDDTTLLPTVIFDHEIGLFRADSQIRWQCRCSESSEQMNKPAYYQMIRCHFHRR